MKYVLLFGDTKERAKQWEAMPEAQRQAAYAPINQWFEKYGKNVTGGHELQPDHTATTVTWVAHSFGVAPSQTLIDATQLIGGVGPEQ